MMMKRGFHGTYHRMFPKHLQRYVSEFAGRHNIHDCDTIDQIIAGYGRRVGWQATSVSRADFLMAPNWKNRTIWTGDNLHIMRGMNSESVDLIYLDPPFNSNKNYEAPIGSQAAGGSVQGHLDPE